MSEYIDREALKKELAPYEENDFSQQIDVILEIVDRQPPADVRPVVYGEKISDGFDEMYTEFFKCTICGCSDLTARSNFCPNCGADMRGGKP